MRRLLVSVLFALGTLASIATSPADELACENEADKAACSDRCDEFVAALREPLPAPAPTVGTCTTINEVVGCDCRVAGEGGGEGEGEGEGEAFFINGEGCAVIGRLGDCLVPPDSFPGCSVDDVTSCTDVCVLVDRQRVDDAAGLVDVELVESSCDYTCDCAIKVEDRCATLVLFNEDGSIDDGYVNADTCAP